MRQENKLEVKLAASSSDGERHRKIELETKQATLDEAQQGESSEIVNHASVEKAVKIDITRNTTSKAKESATADAFPEIYETPDASPAVVHKKSVPNLDDPAKKVGWDKVKYLALGNNHHVDFASAVRLKASVEAMKNTNAPVEATENLKVPTKSTENSDVRIDNVQDMKLHHNSLPASGDGLGVGATQVNNVELRHRPTRKIDTDDVVKDKYEEAKDVLLGAYDAIVLDDNTFDSPSKHPIQNEPWDIKDAEIDYGRTCAGPSDCVVS